MDGTSKLHGNHSKTQEQQTALSDLLAPFLTGPYDHLGEEVADFVTDFRTAAPKIPGSLQLGCIFLFVMCPLNYLIKH